MRIHSVIGDVHKLPFPDNHFDVVTLQWATRHLRVKQVFDEIRRAQARRALLPLRHAAANPLVELFTTPTCASA